MLVIGFFRDFFSSFGGLIDFITTPNEYLSDVMGFQVSILSILGVSIVGFLALVLALHIFHLLKPVG